MSTVNVKSEFQQKGIKFDNDDLKAAHDAGKIILSPQWFKDLLMINGDKYRPAYDNTMSNFSFFKKSLAIWLKGVPTETDRGFLQLGSLHGVVSRYRNEKYLVTALGRGEDVEDTYSPIKIEKKGSIFTNGTFDFAPLGFVSTRGSFITMMLENRSKAKVLVKKTLSGIGYSACPLIAHLPINLKSSGSDLFLIIFTLDLSRIITDVACSSSNETIAYLTRHNINITAFDPKANIDPSAVYFLSNKDSVRSMVGKRCRLISQHVSGSYCIQGGYDFYCHDGDATGVIEMEVNVCVSIRETFKDLIPTLNVQALLGVGTYEPPQTLVPSIFIRPLVAMSKAPLVANALASVRIKELHALINNSSALDLVHKKIMVDPMRYFEKGKYLTVREVDAAVMKYERDPYIRVGSIRGRWLEVSCKEENCDVVLQFSTPIPDNIHSLMGYFPKVTAVVEEEVVIKKKVLVHESKGVDPAKYATNNRAKLPRNVIDSEVAAYFNDGSISVSNYRNMGLLVKCKHEGCPDYVILNVAVPEDIHTVFGWSYKDEVEADVDDIGEDFFTLKEDAAPASSVPASVVVSDPMTVGLETGNFNGSFVNLAAWKSVDETAYELGGSTTPIKKRKEISVSDALLLKGGSQLDSVGLDFGYNFLNVYLPAGLKDSISLSLERNEMAGVESIFIDSDVEGVFTSYIIPITSGVVGEFLSSVAGGVPEEKPLFLNLKEIRKRCKDRSAFIRGIVNLLGCFLDNVTANILLVFVKIFATYYY